MKYDMRRCKKWPEHLTTEEWEVATALDEAGYKHDPYAIRSFVPTRVLYREYIAYIRSKPYRHLNDDPPDDLSIKQFGAALNRAWCEPQRVYRTWHGKRCWGYVGVTGPEAIETRDEPGRPRINPVSHEN